MSFHHPDTFAVAIYEARERVWHASGLRNLELGRQVRSETGSEPGKYGLVEGARSSRVVVADNAERAISRRQLRLQIGDEGLSVTNASEIRPVVVNGQALSPRTTILPNVESVVNIELPGRTVIVGLHEADVVNEEVRMTLPSDNVVPYVIAPDPPLHHDFHNGVASVVLPFTDEESATRSSTQLLQEICQSLCTHQMVLAPHSRSAHLQASVVDLESWDAFSGDLGELIAVDLRDACGDSGDFSIRQFYKLFWRQFVEVLGLSGDRESGDGANCDGENCERDVLQVLKSRTTPLVLWFFNMHVVPSESRRRLQGLTQGAHRSVVCYVRERA